MCDVIMTSVDAPRTGLSVYLVFCVYLTECFMSVFSISAYYCFHVCVFSEFIVACNLCCMFWLPYGVKSDDKPT